MANVLMRHPDRKDVIEVTERAYDQVWEAKGWELVNPYASPLIPEDNPQIEVVESFDATTFEAAELTPPSDPPETRIPVLESMPESELRDVAEDLGIEGWRDLSANELRSLIGNTPDFYDV